MSTNGSKILPGYVVWRIVIASILVCILFGRLLQSPAFAYEFKYISDSSQKKAFLTAYHHYSQFRSNHKKRRYDSAIKALMKLSKVSQEMKLFAYDKMAVLLVRHYPSKIIIQTAAKNHTEFRSILFKNYISRFLAAIAGGKISKQTAADFVAVFNYMNHPQLQKVRIYLYNKGTDAYNDILKEAWLENNLPVTSSKNHIFFNPKAIRVLKKNASYEDWLTHYTNKYEDRKYRYITKNISTQIRWFKTATFYPHDLYYLYYKSLYRSRKYSAFLKELYGSGMSGEILSRHKDLIFFVMNTYLRLEKYYEAEYLIDKLEQSSANSEYISQLKFIVGKHYFKNDNNKFNAILKLFRQINIKYLNKQDYEDIHWFVLNIRLTQSNLPELVDDIQDLWENTNNNTYASGYCYWTKKILHTQNLKNKKDQVCANLYTNYYYGIKSVIFETPKSLFTTCNGKELAVLRNKQDDLVLEWYAVLNKSYDFETVNLLLKSSEGDFSLYVLDILVNELERKNQYHHVQSILAEFYQGWWNKSWPEPIKSCGYFYKIAYPLAYKDIVEKNAKKYGVSTHLIYSIMREESHFNPKAVSSSNAIGLMQLIKPTARFVAAKTRQKYSKKKLYTPEYNIRFGTYYISNLLSRFSDSTAYSLAAYNGGPTHVKRWIKANGHFDEDIFIELIPFLETRKYVKKVTRTYYLYKNIY